MRYLISYDLIAPGKDYQALWDELERLGAFRVLLSQWVVRRINTDAARLRDHLKSFVDFNDRILVVCLDNSNWGSYRALVNINDI